MNRADPVPKKKKLKYITKGRFVLDEDGSWRFDQVKDTVIGVSGGGGGSERRSSKFVNGCLAALVALAGVYAYSSYQDMRAGHTLNEIMRDRNNDIREDGVKELLQAGAGAITSNETKSSDSDNSDSADGIESAAVSSATGAAIGASQAQATREVAEIETEETPQKPSKPKQPTEEQAAKETEEEIENPKSKAPSITYATGGGSAGGGATVGQNGGTTGSPVESVQQVTQPMVTPSIFDSLINNELQNIAIESLSDDPPSSQDGS